MDVAVTPRMAAGGLLDLKLGHYSKDGIEVVNVEDEIDIYTAPRLRELLIDLVGKNNYQLIVNLEKVGFLDSTGLGVLVGGLKRVRPAISVRARSSTCGIRQQDRRSRRQGGCARRAPGQVLYDPALRRLPRRPHPVAARDRGRALREAITDGWLACAPPRLARDFLAG